jgi:SAM-dependent methyltransferase
MTTPSDTRVQWRHRLQARSTRSFLRLNERAWQRLDPRVRELRPVRVYGGWLHGVVGRHADREMYLGTHFLRNRPALELIRRLVERSDGESPFRLGVLGCSIGAEVYSIVWALRTTRPDLEIAVQAVDISPEVIEVARRGVYSTEASEMVHASIFEGLSEAECAGLFDWDGDEGRIRAWLRERITWQVGDASDPDLVTGVGLQDLVVANNFLCHLPAPDARSCLRTLARLVRPGGYLVVTGVDLDVRTGVAREFGWEPLSELRAEIHDGDHRVRADWPSRWWGLEPVDRRQRDWETRYTAVFRLPQTARGRQEVTDSEPVPG